MLDQYGLKCAGGPFPYGVFADAVFVPFLHQLPYVFAVVFFVGPESVAAVVVWIGC